MAELADVVQELKTANETQDFLLMENAVQLEDLRDSNQEIVTGVGNMVSTLEQIRNNLVNSLEIQKQTFEIQTGKTFEELEAQREAARAADGDKPTAGQAGEEETPQDKEKGGFLSKLFKGLVGAGVIAALLASQEQLTQFGTFLKEKVIPGFKSLYENGLKPFFESVIDPILNWAGETALPAVGDGILRFFEDLTRFFSQLGKAGEAFKNGDFFGPEGVIGTAIMAFVELIVDGIDNLATVAVNMLGLDTGGQALSVYLEEAFSNFTEKAKEKILSVIAGLLPDPNSFVGRNLIPNSVYEALGLPATTPDEPEPTLEERAPAHGNLPDKPQYDEEGNLIAMGKNKRMESEMGALGRGSRPRELPDKPQYDEEGNLIPMGKNKRMQSEMGALGRGGGRAELTEKLIPSGEAAENIPPARFLSYHEAGYEVTKGSGGWMASIELPDGRQKTFYEDGKSTISGADGTAFFDSQGKLIKTSIPSGVEGLTVEEFADGGRQTTYETTLGSHRITAEGEEQMSARSFAGSYVSDFETVGSEEQKAAGARAIQVSDAEIENQKDIFEQEYLDYLAREADTPEGRKLKDDYNRKRFEQLYPGKSYDDAKAAAAPNPSLTAPVGKASTEVAAAASSPTIVAPQTTNAPTTNNSSVTNINNATTVGSTSARPAEPSFMRVQDQYAGYY